MTKDYNLLVITRRSQESCSVVLKLQLDHLTVSLAVITVMDQIGSTTLCFTQVYVYFWCEKVYESEVPWEWVS